MTTGGVPIPATGMIGRETELTAVSDVLMASTTRLVTITGPPGVGKTRLAQDVAAQVVGEFADGVTWVELAPVREAGQLVAEIARALQVGQRAPATGVGPVITALAGRDVLLVLDNCEHLLDGVPEINELLASSPRLRILATSRERLRLTIEHEYALPPLPMPTDVDVNDLERLGHNPSVALLLARAPSAVQLTERTSRALSDICVRLDGLPLAIELAAARLRVFTPSELAFRLEHQGEALTSAVRDRPSRHRDITAAIAWSHELLPEAERTVFRRASVFAGTWTLTDAASVTPNMTENAVITAVESLLDKSLVQRLDVAVGAADEGRFSMLYSVREFAAARLDESGEADDARRLHLHHFGEAAARWEATIATDEETRRWPWTEFARLNLLAALRFGCERGDVEATLKVATALGWYWYTHGSLADVAGIREIIHDAIESDAGAGDVRTAALVASGVVSVGIGDHVAAERDLGHAVRLCLAAGDNRRLGIASAFLGHAARGRGEYELAGERYGMARRAFEALDSPRGIAWAAHDMGVLAYESGDYPQAATRLREALHRFREREYPWAVAVSACALASALIAAEQFDEAPQLLGEALVVHDSVGDRRGVAQCLETLAALALARHDAATAGRLLGSADAWRTAAAAAASKAEQARLAALDESIADLLGRQRADRERHSGRTLAPVASIALAAAFAANASAGSQPEEDDGTLTARQREVAALIAAGNTNRQIGRVLGISEKTAEVHVRNIMERLATPSRAGVAAWAAARHVRPPTA